MEASAPAWVHGSAGMAHGHGGFASYPPAPQLWAPAPAQVPAGAGFAPPGLVAHGRPQLAPIDIGLAMGSPNGYILEEFETLVLHDSHSHYQQSGDDGTLAQNREALHSQATLEAALTGYSLDDNSQAFNAMGD